MQGQVEGECHIHLHKQGVRYRQIDCEVYDRKAGLGFSFRLTSISETTHKQF